MELLVALERHSHFARAAQDCNISQPAFSTRIRNLELDLGISIVKRGNRFAGFTPEGEIVLRWARRLLQDADGMRQEITEATTGLQGVLAIGVVPTALAFAAQIPSLIRDNHKKLKVEITSLPSSEIKRGIENYTYDAGITYVEETETKGLKIIPLYEEEYTLVAPDPFVAGKVDTISWVEVAELPLCLLSKTMRNRRIIEEVFTSLGLSVEPVMETNALTVSMTQAEMGNAATIVPGALANLVQSRPGITALKITDPTVTRPIGLLLAQREPMPPALSLLQKITSDLSR